MKTGSYLSELSGRRRRENGGQPQKNQILFLVPSLGVHLRNKLDKGKFT